MDLRRVAGSAVIVAFCMLASGCVTIEQEIFLNPDGSGEMVVFVSLPDLPEKMGPAEVGKKSPADTFAEFKRDLTTGLPPSVTLKEAKEVKQNGVQSMYAVFHFKQLDEVQRILSNFGKESLKEGDIGTDAQWTLQTQKSAGKTHFLQKFFLNVEAKAKAEVKAEVKVNGKPLEMKKTPDQEKASNDLEEQLKPLLLSLIRMRFVLHTSSPITDANADMVLNGKTAVWNCSLAAFAKVNKAIEMKASF